MEHQAHYPDFPGYKRAGTSEDAARFMRKRTPRLKLMVIQCLAKGVALTADEIADTLDVSFLAIRPRLSELRVEGFVKDSGERALNTSGRTAIKWELVT